MDELAKWEMAGETDFLEENLPPTLSAANRSNSDSRCGKPPTNSHAVWLPFQFQNAFPPANIVSCYPQLPSFICTLTGSLFLST
jgi:hypothetical protein